MSTELISFAEILNNCLEAIERGEATAQECLTWYPEHQAQLRPLLTMAGRLGELHSVQPSAAFRTQAEARLQARLISGGRPPQSGNGNGSGPASGAGGVLSSGLGKLGPLLLGLSVAAGLAVAFPRPDNPDTDSPTIEPPTVQFEQPTDEAEPPSEAAPATDVGASYDVLDVFPLGRNDPLTTPEQTAPPGLVADPVDISPNEAPTVEDSSSNNSHGNNLNGVDSSSPSQGIDGPNGEDAPSSEVDDESGSADNSSGNNGHGNNIDSIDSSNPSQGIGGPNEQDDPSGEVDDEGGGGNNSNSRNGNDPPGKDK